MKKSYVVLIEDLSHQQGDRVVQCVIIKASNEFEADSAFVKSPHFGKIRTKRYIYKIIEAKKISNIQRFIWGFC
jgi:hypothetical protein